MPHAVLRLFSSREADLALLRSLTTTLRTSNEDCPIAGALIRVLDEAADLRKVATLSVRACAEVAPEIPTDDVRAGLIALPTAFRVRRGRC